MTTQAEKWRQWKLKMRETGGSKHNNNVEVGCVANNVCDGLTHSESLGSDMSHNEKLNTELSVSRTTDKTCDKTLKMVEDFVKQCKKHSKVSRTSSQSMEDQQHHLFGATSKTNITGIKEKEGLFNHRRRPEKTYENNQGAESLESKQTRKRLQNESNFNRNSHESCGVPSYRISSEESQPTIVPKRPAKKVYDDNDKRLSGQRNEEPTKKKRPGFLTKTPTTTIGDKCRRTVQIANDNSDKDSEEQKTPGDALTKKGQRLMINYMAGYETSSDSMDEDEVFICKPVTPAVTDVKFIAHLSCSMKNIKPYRSIIFDVIETNAGKSYSPTTGRFKAPVPGTYVFFLTVTSSPSEQVDVNIMHNFHPIEGTKIKTSTLKDGDMQTRTEAMILTLERKDEIWVLNVTRAPQAKLLEKCHFLTFSGSLFKV